VVRVSQRRPPSSPKKRLLSPSLFISSASSLRFSPSPSLPWLWILFLPISATWDHPTGLSEPSSKGSGTQKRSFLDFPLLREICTNFSFMVPFLQFLFCKKKTQVPGPRTLTLRMMTGTSGGSTARRSSQTPTSQGS
jgi:hypothetical protein